MMIYLFVALFLAVPVDPLATARRLMLDGNFDQAVPVLTVILEDETSSLTERSRAGFLLETIDQARTFSAGGDGMADALVEPTVPAGTAEYAMTVIPGESGGWVRGTFGMDLSLSEPVVNRGDSIRIWMPIAGETGTQDPDQPSWNTSGLDILQTEVRTGGDLAFPVLFLAGVVSENSVAVSFTQGVTAYGAAPVDLDPEEVILAVPGTDAETDRALATSDIISTGGNMYILALRMAGGDPHPVDRLESIISYARDSIGSMVDAWALRAAEGFSPAVVRTGQADGLSLAVLLAAACRVNGIPCRVTGGWSSSPDGPVRHTRAEYMLLQGTWTPLDLPMAVAAELDGLDGSIYLEGGCDAARVYTFESLEDSLTPALRSWPVSPPGSYPQVEVRAAGGYWTAVPLRYLYPGTVVRLDWTG